MPSVRIIPFSPGRRPTDEARHPGMGSSDAVAFLEGDYYLLSAISGAAGCELVVGGRVVVPAVFDEDGSLRETSLEQDRTYVVVLRRPPRHLCLRDALLAAARARGAPDPRRDDGGLRRGPARGLRRRARSGSLYERIVERLVKPDTARQAPGLSHAYHPWFPVLLIGAHKAELYTRALVGDIVHKRRHLADPGWLVRVGLYLELLTALGIVEAVKDDAGDLLTPEEREAFERSPAFAEIRSRVNVEGWRGVWALRQIVTRGLPRAGPVSALNLLAKRRATLRVPARSPRGPAARDRARRAERRTCAGDVAPRVPRRRARRAAPDAGRIPGARRPPGRGAPVRALAPPGAGRAAAGAARAGAAAEAARRPGRPVRLGLQPVPGVDEPRRRLGARAGPDGPHRRGGGAARGEPVRGARQPAVAGRAAAAPRWLRLRPPGGRRGAARGLRAAAEGARRAAGRDGAVLDPERRGDRAAGPHGAAAAVRPAGADHRPGPAGRLAVRGRRRDGRGVPAARRRHRRAARHRARTPSWARCGC